MEIEKNLKESNPVDFILQIYKKNWEKTREKSTILDQFLKSKP